MDLWLKHVNKSMGDFLKELVGKHISDQGLYEFLHVFCMMALLAGTFTLLARVHIKS